MTGTLYDAERLGVTLGMGPKQVMEMNRREAWPHVRLGRKVRWTQEQVAEIVRRHVVIPSPSITGGHPPGITPRSRARRSA